MARVCGRREGGGIRFDLSAYRGRHFDFVRGVCVLVFFERKHWILVGGHSEADGDGPLHAPPRLHLSSKPDRKIHRHRHRYTGGCGPYGPCGNCGSVANLERRGKLADLT